MKKILINTMFYQNYNYGGILQAYSLYHKLEMMGYVCEELKYTRIITNPIVKLLYRWFRIIEIAKNPLYYFEKKKELAVEAQLKEKYIHINGMDLMKEVFEKFINNEFKTTEVFSPSSIKRIDQDYDYHIVGGDQVWNPEWCDRNSFLKYVKKGKKIAFSCSAGKSVFSKYDQRKLLKYIHNLDVVSVREFNLNKFLTEHKVENEIIADPVFLLERKEWENFASQKYKLPRKYVFAYLLGKDKKRRELVRKFAKKNGFTIVSIPHLFRFYNENEEGFADIEIYDAGPREFVELIMKSSFVVTDSFHGTVFSLILRKQFLCFNRSLEKDLNNQNSRLLSLLRMYGLDNRMVSIDELETLFIADIEQIDYKFVEDIICENREKAVRFLERNLCER